MNTLETGEKIDNHKFVYIRTSQGGYYRSIIPAIEDYPQASILESEGLQGDNCHEVKEINYMSSVDMQH